MPLRLFTVTMKGGHTIQVRAHDKEDAKRQAIERVKHWNQSHPEDAFPPAPKSVRANK